MGTCNSDVTYTQHIKYVNCIYGLTCVLCVCLCVCVYLTAQRDCWPVYDKKQEQQFRKACSNWIARIAKVTWLNMYSWSYLPNSFPVSPCIQIICLHFIPHVYGFIRVWDKAIEHQEFNYLCNPVLTLAAAWAIVRLVTLHWYLNFQSSHLSHTLVACDWLQCYDWYRLHSAGNKQWTALWPFPKPLPLEQNRVWPHETRFYHSQWETGERDLQ